METLILEFLNTDWIIRIQGKEDPLYNEVWLNSYFKKVIDSDIKSSEALSVQMINLRTLFINAIEALVIDELNVEVLIKELNKYFAVTPGIRKIINIEDKYEMSFEINQVTGDFILAELCFLLYKLLFESEKERVRICENPDCRYIFYDNSRNKSKRHCHDGCANIMKVRRFREKNATK